MPVPSQFYNETTAPAGHHSSDPVVVRFAKRIRYLRERKDISQRETARLLGMSDSAVCKWELGNASPLFRDVPRIAAFFGVTIEELFR